MPAPRARKDSKAAERVAESLSLALEMLMVALPEKGFLPFVQGSKLETMRRNLQEFRKRQKKAGEL